MFSALLILVGAQLVAAPSVVDQRRSDEIVVVGSAIGSEAEAGALSRKISVMTDGQLARFRGSVCISVLGLPDSYAAAVMLDLSKDARFIGLHLEGKGCKPNLTAMFVKDGAGTVKALPAVSSAARDRELAHGGPSYAFDSTETTSRDGDILARASQPIGSGSDRDMQFLQVRNVSIIKRSTRQNVNGLLLVIERSAIVGKTLRQVSSYITMRGLGRASDRQVAAGDATILALLKSPAEKTPSSLTAFDEAYLKALYRDDGTRDGAIRGSEIVDLASSGLKKSERARRK